MKAPSKLCVVALAGALSLNAPGVRAAVEISAAFSINATADFYAPLTPHGVWIDVDTYGRCWHPHQVAVGWRPYGFGHWVWTDVGWYWVSDEPWAWACYHYGSWVHHGHHGWIWVPGTEWAPAWVSWRVGGGYIGWAPLPPRHVSVHLASPAFAFVELRHFHQPVRPGTLIVNNTTIINQTTVINNMRAETRNVGAARPHRVMVNEGPGLEPVQKATGNKIAKVSVREAVQRTPIPANIRSQAARPKEAQSPQPGEETEQSKAKAKKLPESQTPAGTRPRGERRDGKKGPPRTAPLPTPEPPTPTPPSVPRPPEIAPPPTPQPPPPAPPKDLPPKVVPPPTPQPPAPAPPRGPRPPELVPPPVPQPPGPVQPEQPPHRGKGKGKGKREKPE